MSPRERASRRRLWVVACLVCGTALQYRFAVEAVQSDPAATARAAFAASLSWRTDRIVADQTHHLQGWLGATTPVAYTSPGALALTIRLETTAEHPLIVKRLPETSIFGGNLAERPFPVSIDLRGVADGDYQYVTEVREGEVLLRSFTTPVKLVAGIDASQADTEARLAKIAGHDSAKASIRYPFDLARVINVGKRVIGSANTNPEFGLSQSGQQSLYDFAAGLERSASLLAALEAGRDPVWRAGGETVRHYYMPEADEILPYHVFVPSSWNGKTSLPLV